MSLSEPKITSHKPATRDLSYKVMFKARCHQERIFLKHKAYFLSNDLVERREEIFKMLNQVITAHKGYYFNSREDAKGAPFMAIKFKSPKFTKNKWLMKNVEKKLEEKGVECSHSPNTNSYIFRFV